MKIFLSVVTGFVIGFIFFTSLVFLKKYIDVKIDSSVLHTLTELLKETQQAKDTQFQTL